MINERLVKIQSLKAQIKENSDTTTDKVKELVDSTDAPETAKLLKVEIATLKGLRDDLKKGLEQVRMNKTSSTFFSFEPHVGMNRAAARRFRRIRHTLKLKKNG